MNIFVNHFQEIESPELYERDANTDYEHDPVRFEGNYESIGINHSGNGFSEARDNVSSIQR